MWQNVYFISLFEKIYYLNVKFTVKITFFQQNLNVLILDSANPPAAYILYYYISVGYFILTLQYKPFDFF